MDERLIELLLAELHEKLGSLRKLVPREVQFPEAAGKIKVAIGMRRAGKTYLLYQKIIELLKKGVPKEAFLYLNFEDDRLWPLDLQQAAKLVDAFYSLYPENHNRKCYLFFDEIQVVENWALLIRRLNDTKKGEIFLTGSSAKLLSKEIATSLRGRSLAIEVWPYSFREYLKAKEIAFDSNIFGQRKKDVLRKLFQEYLSTGGFPEISSFQDDVRIKTLQEYLDLAILRDLVERYEIKHPSLIRYFILSLLHNVGKPFTIHKFYKDIQSQGYSTAKDILYDYANFIEDAFLAFFVPLHDRSIRKIQTNPKKIYAIDPGLVRAFTLEYETDLGRLFENIVYLEMRRKGFDVSYYLTKERYEVDFLTKTARGEKKLFQVAWDIENLDTQEREMRALDAAKQELKIEGELITLDSFLKQSL